MAREWLGRWSLACGLIVGVGLGIADEPGVAKKTTGYIVQKPITPASVRVPGSTPDELEKFMAQSTLNRISRENGLDSEEALCFSAFAKMATAEKIYQHPAASTRQKTSLRQTAIQAMNSLLRLDAAKYRPYFDDYVALIVKSDPNSQAAQYGQAHQFRRDSKMDDNEPPADLAAQTIAFARKHPKSPFSKQFLDRIGKQLEKKQPADALQVYRTALELFPNDIGASSWRGIVTRLEMPGKPMEFSGPTLDGKPFNIQQLKGKVVLVFFWSTFSGQSNRETQMLKAVYQNLHNSGFEIVGISLDRTRESVERYVKERQISWPQIYFTEYRQTGWDNPIVKQYAIANIPVAFLLGKDGKVTAHRYDDEASLTAVIETELKK